MVKRPLRPVSLGRDGGMARAEAPQLCHNGAPPTTLSYGYRRFAMDEGDDKEK